MAKKPGPELDLESAQTSIPLASLKDADPLPPYVRLIHDVLLGDRSLFTRRTAWPRCGRWLDRCWPTRPGSRRTRRGRGGLPKPAGSSRRDAGCLVSKRSGCPGDQLLVDCPGWLDWPWALRVLDQEVRVTGEEVRPAEGVVATACLVADQPLVVTVTGGESRLTVQPSAAALGEFVVRRFSPRPRPGRRGRGPGTSQLAGLFGRDGWVRRPAAAMLWSYLPGLPVRWGEPDAPPRPADVR